MRKLTYFNTNHRFEQILNQSFKCVDNIVPKPYLTEVFRGGLLALPRGLRDAGLAIGMTEGRGRIWVIVPVMVRNVLPALSNNFISLFKDTSLAAAIAVPELTFYARQQGKEGAR